MDILRRLQMSFGNGTLFQRKKALQATENTMQAILLNLFFLISESQFEKTANSRPICSWKSEHISHCLNDYKYM